MDISNSYVENEGEKTPYSLIRQERGTDTLAVILPGAGYTAQAPLLYYTTGIFCSRGFDVLHVNYSFDREQFAALSEEKFTETIRAVIDSAVGKRSYQHYCLAAKSLGTIALPRLLEEERFREAKALWMTPLIQRDDVFESLAASRHESLVILGDQDPCFRRERFEELERNRRLELSLIKDANHSLEIEGNVHESMDVLKSVISVISRF
ncbi:alpha/beta family hydrolase [Alteribacter natronophilus]|uniref:alpha/beta family hydrolase n=1 Tax=Alteribacter natronophilus TaxID=2583810 RepID=UPI00110E57DB|nr:alpha/beta family hydrolase [Alteribacter natronophilus]TMW71574.1 alpha/beta hydrolase [Alteribacter natronophilus]